MDESERRQQLAGVQAAVERGEWQQALDRLDELDVGRGSPAWSTATELRAQAAYGLGDLEGAVSAWEEVHTHLGDAGDRRGAARAAAMVAMFLMMDTGLMAPVRGWLRRAQRLCAGDEGSPARALVAMVRTYERFMCGDMGAAREAAEEAVELGTQLGVQPAVVIGRTAVARIRIFDGDLEEGLELLDEVGALLMAGGADPLTTGMMYCELICAAQGLALHDRAREWTEVMERWRPGAAVGGINGRCRVHRAEMLRLSGPCDRAEAEALRACEELRPWMRREFGWPLAELGNVRLRKGDLAGAEEAFVAAHEHAWTPHPGLALVRLAEGDVDAALALIREAIDHPFNVPSKERPPFGDLRLAPLLEALAEIASAAGAAQAGRQAADGLRAVADAYRTPALMASAALADARAALSAGRVDDAITSARTAIAGWTDVGAPYETAVARMVLGEALERSGHADAARMEWRAAREGFASFGAMLWAERAAERLAGPSLRDTAPAPALAAGHPPMRATFRRDGEMRTLALGSEQVHVRDLKGLRYVERLLAEPGREFHVLDLIAVEHGALPPPRRARADLEDGLAPAAEGVSGGLPLLDDRAKAAYRRRLAEVDDDIEEALRNHDPARAELAEADRAYLVAELTRAVGLGNRSRTSGGTSERARTSVARAIRYAIARVAEHHRSLAAHLDQHVETGTYCRYVRDERAPVVWEL